MANQTVRIYDHQKQSNGEWKSISVDFSIDPAKTAKQLVYKLGIKGCRRKGNFKISWYEGSIKKFERGSYPLLEAAVKATKFRQVQLQGKSNGIVIEDPKAKDAGRLTIDIAAAAYLNTEERIRAARYLRAWRSSTLKNFKGGTLARTVPSEPS
jgi:hypothetical protein